MMMQKDNLTFLLTDLSASIIQKQRELLYVINPDLLNLLSTPEEVISHRVFKAELKKYSLDKMDWLNTNLNLSLWELGMRINQETIKEPFLKDILLQLVEKYGHLFSEIDLHTMAKFAELFPDRNVALGISMLVRWEYFSILLSLSEVGAIFFYAKLTATKGLSVTDLQNEITNKVYEKTMGAKKQERDAIYALQNPVTKTKVTTKGNSTVVGTTIYIDDSTVINPDVINVFKNSSLYILTPGLR